MNWLSAFSIFQTALSIFSTLGPEIIEQHWDGTGTDGKINNVVQIVKDVGAVAGTFAQNLLASPAIAAPHPEVAAAAGVTVGQQQATQQSVS